MICALDQARTTYAAQRIVFDVDLANYLRAGFVFSEPDRLLLGRPIVLAEPSRWLQPDAFGDADAWYVRFAIGPGALRWFIGQMPWQLPSLAWHRAFKGQDRSPLHVYETATVVAKLRK